MTDIPAPPDFELPSLEGLPEEPWTVEADESEWWTVISADEEEIASLIDTEKLARAIASIPDMVRKIERMRKAIEEPNNVVADAITLQETYKAEADSLRTLNAELIEALDVARICLKNRDRSELEEKAYFGIRAVLIKAKAGEGK